MWQPRLDNCLPPLVRPVVVDSLVLILEDGNGCLLLGPRPRRYAQACQNCYYLLPNRQMIVFWRMNLRRGLSVTQRMNFTPFAPLGLGERITRCDATVTPCIHGIHAKTGGTDLCPDTRAPGAVVCNPRHITRLVTADITFFKSLRSSL